MKIQFLSIQKKIKDKVKHLYYKLEDFLDE